MDPKRILVAALLGIAAGLSVLPAAASTFGFSNITNNKPQIDIANQLTLDVTQSGNDALFTVHNLGPVGSSISEVYFDFGTTNFFTAPTPETTIYNTTTVTKDASGKVLSTTSTSSTKGSVGTSTKTTTTGTGKNKQTVTVVTTTTQFTTPASNGGIKFAYASTGVIYQDGAKPANLPGGNVVNFTADDSGSAVNPSPTNGVNPGEWVSFLGLFSSGNYAGLIDAIANKTFRIGLHIQSVGPNGISDSYVNTNVSPVPLPAALPLMLSALGLLGFASRPWRRTQS